ncbi:Uncharacterised protein [Leclercia adecarboxylata]|uniref:Uncharacterized protein n=1 Tax=Leclercia adecarboxylata TaxID=83655 RepID=A0A4V6JJ73_9ENTR|nr:Uncharacterised protein [Leclercia adecarboxylata]
MNTAPCICHQDIDMTSCCFDLLVKFIKTCSTADISHNSTRFFSQRHNCPIQFLLRFFQ